jgi:hypothetical protein
LRQEAQRHGAEQSRLRDLAERAREAERQARQEAEGRLAATLAEFAALRAELERLRGAGGGA